MNSSNEQLGKPSQGSAGTVDLLRHGSLVRSAFDLLGQKENDLTAALAFALSNSPAFLRAVLSELGSLTGIPEGEPRRLSLEKADAEGRTDLEILLDGSLLIVEAKRGWQLPTEKQLRRYAGRVRREGGGALITLSQSPVALAAARLPREIGGVQVLHVPWHGIQSRLIEVRRRTRGRERLWLDELDTYLRGAIQMIDVADCWTYCVALNNERLPGSPLTFREYVTEELTYFHPYGINAWPTEPPNFMAFRWDGAVQLIHRVVSATVVATLLEHYPDLPPHPDRMRPHAVYKLSPKPIPLSKPIKNGSNYRAGRMKVLLDQLLMSQTLAEALKRSHQLDDSWSPR
jgi:hypothetical protein